MYLINIFNALNKSAPFVLTCMVVETILHICNTKQYIINNLIKVYTNFKWKFQIILNCTLCIFAFGEMLASRKCTLQKGLNVMHAFSPLIQKFHFKEVYLSRDILHCKMFLYLFQPTHC